MEGQHRPSSSLTTRRTGSGDISETRRSEGFLPLASAAAAPRANFFEGGRDPAGRLPSATAMDSDAHAMAQSAIFLCPFTGEGRKSGFGGVCRAAARPLPCFAGTPWCLGHFSALPCVFSFFSKYLRRICVRLSPDAPGGLTSRPELACPPVSLPCSLRPPSPSKPSRTATFRGRPDRPAPGGQLHVSFHGWWCVS